ncbi:hypothetical protein MJO29_004322 [Puccinia striiformis f. sp. tritici]|nr:hypothetical protein MJO29_004322 [Puccinia striiformis f. sp. tritici]
MERPRKLRGLRAQLPGGTENRGTDFQPAQFQPSRTNPQEELFSNPAPAVHTEGEINFAQKKMSNDRLTRDALVAEEALLEQKRRTTIGYLESRRARGGDPNGNTIGNSQENPNSPEENQRNTTNSSSGRNQLGEILGALGDTQATGERQEESVRDNRINTQQPTTTDDRTLDQSFLLKAARLAMEKGNQKEAEGLLRSLAALFPEQEENRRDGRDTTQPPHVPEEATTNKEGEARGSIKKIGGVSYMIGEVPDYTFAGLPSFYDKNVKAMKGSIPLTIFDPVWQRIAAASRAEKKTIDRIDTEERRYTGVAAPDEWSQSHAQWSRNYQSFIANLKEVYNFDVFSGWFLIHRDRCDLIMRREGFCAGFRYNLAVRANAFQCDFVKNETTLFPDISKYREDIAEETLAEARRNGEIGYLDNPYINGGEKEHFDPHTGAKKYSYSRERSDDRGRNGNRPQQKPTLSRYKTDYPASKTRRDEYEQGYPCRREGRLRGEGDRPRGGDVNYDERARDRSKFQKTQHGYRNEQTRGRKRFE